ncbi:MAG TPA: MarR family transcriptional regulator [Stellaceae bacterium]|nr:MarR family transcriptional regulator [Stellaceae bacterium]
MNLKDGAKMRKNDRLLESAEELGEVASAWALGGENFLPNRVLILAKMLDRLTGGLLHESEGLSVAEWRVLVQLAVTSPATVRQLAEKSWVDRAEVSRAAASLERRGDVVRRDNPSDGRSTLFSLTEQGWALFQRVWPQRMELHAGLTERLDPRQRAVFEEVLLILAQECVERLQPEEPDAGRLAELAEEEE